MGGQAKQISRIGGLALVSRAARAALGARLDPVIVVLGHEADAVRAALAADLPGAPLLLVSAARHREGMAESLKAGVAALPDGANGAFVLLADMPFVSAALIERIAAAFTPDKLAAAPVWNGRRGNPVLLSPRALAMAGALTGDRGLGPILSRHEDELALAPADDDSCLRDVDTPNDLAAAQERP